MLARVKGDRVGLIVFAGASVVKVPLTTDQGFFEMVLDDIDFASAPRGGSLIGDAIRKALVSLPEEHDRDQVLVLITDGEDHDSFPLDAAKVAKQRGIRIVSIGFGDEVGSKIEITDARTGVRSFVKDAGGRCGASRYSTECCLLSCKLSWCAERRSRGESPRFS